MILAHSLGKNRANLPRIWKNKKIFFGFFGTKISHSLGNFRASFTRLEKFFWHVTCMGKIFFGILVLAKIMPRSVLVLGNFRANLLVSSETNPFGVKKWSIIDHFSSAFFAFCGHFLTILKLFSFILFIFLLSIESCTCERISCYWNGIFSRI